MLGRQVGSSLLRFSIYARLPLRPSPLQCAQELAPRALFVSSQRFYAKPGRPRKVVGEPSKPVKRAVKRSAKATSEDEPATEQVKAKKSTAAAKKSTTSAKKKKARPKKRVRKELTEEQKAAAQAKTTKAKVTALKKVALSPPANPTYSAYIMFMKEKAKGADTGSALHSANRSEEMKRVMQPVVDAWKSLSAAELEHYNHLAQQATEAAQAEFRRWVKSHTPEEIHAANNARRYLRRLLELKYSHKYQQIKDERSVKRPASAYIQFSVNRQASGDFKNILVGERAKLIAQEWKALNESEKKKYKDLQHQDRDRYSSEYNDVHGHLPPSMENGRQAAAAAA